MNVIVTGGSGLLGQHLKMIRPEWTYLSSRDCDFTNSNDTEYLFKHIKPKTVIHLAAKVGGIQFNIENQPELLEENLLINTNVIRNAHNNGARIIAALSTCIYPQTCSEYPMTEDDICEGQPQPSNLGYAVAKRAMWHHIHELNKKYNTKHCCFVPSNMYGCSKKDVFSKHAHFVPALIRKIYDINKNLKNINNEAIYANLTMMGDGTPLRQFTYAGDVADIIKDCVEYDNYPEIFNIATPENLSIKEMVEIAVKKLCIYNCSIKWNTSKPNGQYRKDVRNYNLLCHLDKEPEFTPFREGIRKVYDFISDN